MFTYDSILGTLGGEVFTIDTDSGLRPIPGPCVGFP